MSYESAMEERILKTFKSKDDLIRKLQAEIDELVDMLDRYVSAESRASVAWIGIETQAHALNLLAKHKGE